MRLTLRDWLHGISVVPAWVWWEVQVWRAAMLKPFVEMLSGYQRNQYMAGGMERCSPRGIFQVYLGASQAGEAQTYPQYCIFHPFLSWWEHRT